MIDLEMFLKSLKICWIKSMLESDDTGLSKNIFLDKLKPFGGTYYLNVTTLKRKYIYLYKTLFERCFSSLVYVY